jgi:hypothetical protein
VIRKAIHIALVVSFSFLIFSCEEPLKVTDFKGDLEYKDTLDIIDFIDKTQNQYQVDNVQYFDFFESNLGSNSEYNWTIEKKRNIVKIDTTLKSTVVWMDLDFSNPDDDKSGPWLRKRMKAFKLKFKGELKKKSEFFVLDGSEFSGLWIEVTSWDIDKNTETPIYYPDIKPVLYIQEFNAEEGFILGQINIDFEGTDGQPSYISNFTGSFRINYRN